MLILLSNTGNNFVLSSFSRLSHLSLSHTFVCLPPLFNVVPLMRSGGSVIFSIVPGGLPSRQQQQIKSEQRWTNRQKFTPLSLSISTAVDNNPDLPFPLAFTPKAPAPPAHFKKTRFHCDCYWQLNLQIHLCIQCQFFLGQQILQCLYSQNDLLCIKWPLLMICICARILNS